MMNSVLYHEEIRQISLKKSLPKFIFNVRKNLFNRVKKWAIETQIEYIYVFRYFFDYV